MNWTLAVTVFIITLFVYIHVYHNLKVSNDLDVYEVESPSKERLEDICEIKQPAVFDIDVSEIVSFMSRSSLCESYSAFDVSVEAKDSDAASKESNLVPLALAATCQMLETDKTGMVVTERNDEFLEETGVKQVLRAHDVFLRPPLVAKCSYDWISGSDGYRTPLRYEINMRTYFVVNEGEVHVKLTQPKNSRFLHSRKDYSNYEFSSPVNVWDVQPQYRADFSRIKCLDVVLRKGQIVYLPPFWWYSLRFDKGTSVTKLSYSTYASTISNLHYHFLSFLQRQNTSHKIAPRVDKQTIGIHSNEQVEAQDIQAVDANNE